MRWRALAGIKPSGLRSGGNGGGDSRQPGSYVEGKQRGLREGRSLFIRHGHEAQCAREVEIVRPRPRAGAVVGVMGTRAGG